MAVFSRRLNPLDSGDTNASFHQLSDHIGYMQECIEFAHQSEDKKRSEILQELKKILKRLDALEKK